MLHNGRAAAFQAAFRQSAGPMIGGDMADPCRWRPPKASRALSPGQININSTHDKLGAFLMSVVARSQWA